MTDNYAVANPVLRKGETVFAPDGRIKVGDGRRHYNDLPFTAGTPGPVGPSGTSTVRAPIAGPTGPQGDPGPTGPTGPSVSSIAGSAITGALNVEQISTQTVNQAACLPVVLFAKGLTVRTSGTPVDLATITVPTGITRWHLLSASSNVALAETGAGTLAGASFAVFTAAAGGGNQVTAAFLGPTNTTSLISIAANSLAAFSTSRSLVIRQTANSANAGTMSFYFTVYPLL